MSSFTEFCQDHKKVVERMISEGGFTSEELREVTTALLEGS
jgi:hypothetical protein